LYQDFKDSKVKVGEDDDGYKIKIKFKYFLEYLIFNSDDSPLYLFESSFENHKHLKTLTKDYEIPNYFKEDFFELVFYS
jgi:histone arginine demethylase JMJD6